MEAELEGVEGIPKEGFDAVICLGNSFAHLPDFEGNQHDHKVALANFWSMVKPGGILMIDHRNYDDILDTGTVPARNIYYSVSKQNLSVSDNHHCIQLFNEE